jgi:3-isopropylmalate/(R)-2-methylmalate dehydratase large subunit
VTSPQAFEGLRLAGRRVRRTDLTVATEDHNTPTGYADPAFRERRGDLLTIADPTSRTQIGTLRRNCAEFGVRLHPLGDENQGIVHVIGPQLGLTQPGMTIVCGDSHTSTHGAFGALASASAPARSGVPANQTCRRMPKTMRSPTVARRCDRRTGCR